MYNLEDIDDDDIEKCKFCANKQEHTKEQHSKQIRNYRMRIYMREYDYNKRQPAYRRGRYTTKYKS